MMIAGEAALAKIPAKVNLGDAEDMDFFQDMAERKLDMKQDKELSKLNLEMAPTEKPEMSGLMARGE